MHPIGSIHRLYRLYTIGIYCLLGGYVWALPPSTQNQNNPCIWSNYSGLTRPWPPKWWFSKGHFLFHGHLGWWNIIFWPDGWHSICTASSFCQGRVLFLSAPWLQISWITRSCGHWMGQFGPGERVHDTDTWMSQEVSKRIVSRL